ncbi:MAG: polysaccharide lyase [Acidobacteriia bacterium]|nr:polysaccharide lyase [Terriglobia bacterium]
MKITVLSPRWSTVIFVVVLLIVLVYLFPFRLLLRPMLSLAGPKPVHVYDGFDSTPLSSHWMKFKMVPGAFLTQSRVVRAGQRAGEITEHEGDLHEDATDCCAPNERDELIERWRYFSNFHQHYRYSFSLYMPPDFPVVPTRLVIAQWTQICEWKGCRPDNPMDPEGPLALQEVPQGGMVECRSLAPNTEITYR